MKKNIAIVKGGNSAEYEVSVKSASVVEKHLSKEKYNTYSILIEGQDWSYTKDEQLYSIDKNDFSLTIDGSTIKFDLVFVAIHGTPGEDGKLQAYFDLLNIPYTTSNSFECALSFNKALTNSYLRPLGVNCGEALYYLKGDIIDTDTIVNKIGLPCFVKPNEAGSSFGISKVNKVEELIPAVEAAFEHSNKVIIEEFLDGTEVTCGIFDFEDQLTTLPITEIVSENDFFDYAAKYEGKSSEITPARISTKEANAVAEATKKIYTLLELKGIARVDFILRNGVPFLIEANTVPGISEESIIPQQAVESGMTLEELFNKWVERFL